MFPDYLIKMQTGKLKSKDLGLFEFPFAKEKAFKKTLSNKTKIDYFYLCIIDIGLRMIYRCHGKSFLFDIFAKTDIT